MLIFKTFGIAFLVWLFADKNIIVPNYEDENDIYEVQEYPTENIIDEVWVKIKVKNLYQKNNFSKSC